jgi:hypothetical protein
MFVEQNQSLLDLMKDLDVRVVECTDGCRINLSVLPLDVLRNILEFATRVYEMEMK